MMNVKFHHLISIIYFEIKSYFMFEERENFIQKDFMGFFGLNQKSLLVDFENRTRGQILIERYLLQDKLSELYCLSFKHKSHLLYVWAEN